MRFDHQPPARVPPAPHPPALSQVSRMPAARAPATQVARWPWDGMWDEEELQEYEPDELEEPLAKTVGARAFTTGQDIFFGAGQYSSASSDGRSLLAHELTHVAQQGSGRR